MEKSKGFLFTQTTAQCYNRDHKYIVSYQYQCGRKGLANFPWDSPADLWLKIFCSMIHKHVHIITPENYAFTCVMSFSGPLYLLTTASSLQLYSTTFCMDKSYASKMKTREPLCITTSTTRTTKIIFRGAHSWSKY